VKTAILDASIAVKAVVQEPHSRNTLTLLRTAQTLHAPAHWLAEAANALWAKVSIHKTLHPDELPPRLAFLAGMPVMVAQLPELIGPAAAIALDLRLTVYDALYLALAQRLDAPLVSDDRKLLAAAARDTRFSQLAVWIGDVSEA
jgi:predicted nucleic acid-binding protein